MEIEKIKNGCLHGIYQHLTVKAMFRISDSQFQYLEIASTYNLLFGRQVHDGIEKKCQRTFHPVIALWRTQFYKTGLRIDYFTLKVIRWLYFFYHFSLADDRQVPGM